MTILQCLDFFIRYVDKPAGMDVEEVRLEISHIGPNEMFADEKVERNDWIGCQ